MTTNKPTKQQPDKPSNRPRDEHEAHREVTPPKTCKNGLKIRNSAAGVTYTVMEGVRRIVREERLVLEMLKEWGGGNSF